MADRLKNKIAIVTGSDSGIGRAIAEAFAREGADVAVSYLTDADGAAQTRQLVEAAGRKAIAVQCDQRDPAQVARLFFETETKLGVPYILVNNAATAGGRREVADMQNEEWDDVIKTDLYGPFYCCREFIGMRRAMGGKGKILNITSVHEDIPLAGAAPYAVAKGGLRNLTRTLALELAPDHINVNNIAPGMVLTPMNLLAQSDTRVRAQRSENIPWKRAGRPDEIARLALYLVSEEADYATGQTYVLDGGLGMSLGQGA